MKPSHQDGEVLLSANPPPIAATRAAVQDVSAHFYELFSDLKPGGPRDLAYFEKLIEDFAHEVDIVEELTRFQAWSLDKGVNAVQYPRSRFRAWLQRARLYQRHSHRKKEE